MATQARERTSREEVSKSAVLLTESDIRIETGLPAQEVDRRLVSLARTDRQVEAALCFYLQEVDRRQLYREYGHASTEAYSRERLGLQDRKTRSLLYMAYRMDELPRMKEEFKAGNIPWTKAREAVKVATKETEEEWLDKCRELSNRQLEDEVRQKLPPVKRKTLVFNLTDDFLEVWEQAREACERQAGKTLSDLQVLDIMCAEVLCTYALTDPMGGKEPTEEYLARILERDGWKCTRPGCECRTGLTVNHGIKRSQGGPSEDWNLHTVCIACHTAVETGRLKVSGRAPDGLTWEGPFGVIEKPLPLDKTASTEKGEQEPAASPAVAFEAAQEQIKVAPEIENESENGQDKELGSSDAPASEPVQLPNGGQRGDLVGEESPIYSCDPPSEIDAGVGASKNCLLEHSRPRGHRLPSLPGSRDPNGGQPPAVSGCRSSGVGQPIFPSVAPGY